jgi:hypothetical protein
LLDERSEVGEVSKSFEHGIDLLGRQLIGSRGARLLDAYDPGIKQLGGPPHQGVFSRSTALGP